MIPETATAPTPLEIENELSKILASDTFRKRPTLARLLHYIVKNTLSGQRLSGKIIAAELFPDSQNRRPQDPPFTGVQANASLLRARLAGYYENEGAEDSVLIKVPPGESYKASFLRNVRSATQVAYQKGVHLSSNPLSPEGVNNSFFYLFQAVSQEPNSADGLAAYAHAELVRSLFTYWQFSVQSARQYAQQALAINQDTWLAHVVLGAVHCCYWEWADASTSFEAALRISKTHARAHFWHIVYLLAVGRNEEALEIVKTCANERPQDSLELTLYGLVLYILRDFKTAQDILLQAGEMDAVNWIAHLLLVCLHLALEDPHSAFSSLCDWPLSRMLPPGLLDMHLKRGRHGGLFLLCLSLAGRRSLARRWMRFLLANAEPKPDLSLKERWMFEKSGNATFHPIHLVLAHLGFDEADLAINCL